MRRAWKQQASEERICLTFLPYRSPNSLPQRAPTRKTFRMPAHRAGRHGKMTSGNTEELDRRSGKRRSTKNPTRDLRGLFMSISTTQAGHGRWAGGTRRVERRQFAIIIFSAPQPKPQPEDRFGCTLFMQILQPRPDPAYVRSHSGARRADRTCNSYLLRA